jgi:hypothetical protein
MLHVTLHAMIARLFLILVLLVGSRCLAAETTAAAEKPVLVFAGYANFFGGPTFVIYDSATDEKSPWMSLSQTWHGYAFVKFDPKGEQLTLRKDGKDLTLALKQSKIVEAFLRPRLLKGTYTIVDDRVVYSADAELAVGDGVVVSAADGVMTADLEQKTIAGNLRLVQRGKHVMEMTEAVLDLNGGRMVGHAAHLTMGPIAP